MLHWTKAGDTQKMRVPQLQGFHSRGRDRGEKNVLNALKEGPARRDWGRLP